VTLADDEKWDEVMELVERIGHVLSGESFDVSINALIYMLASGGAQSNLSRPEFLAKIYEQVGDWYDQFNEGEEDGSREIQ
jgi:hypothetical protein